MDYATRAKVWDINVDARAEKIAHEKSYKCYCREKGGFVAVFATAYAYRLLTRQIDRDEGNGVIRHVQFDV